MQGKAESSSEESDSGNEFVFDSDEDMETDQMAALKEKIMQQMA